MKITYIHQHFKLPTQGGGGRPFEFASRLAARGHDVTVLAAGSRRETRQVDGLTIEFFASRYDNTMGVARRIRSFADFMVKTSVHAARRPADVVFASSTPLTVVIPGAIAKHTQRARFVVEVRDLWPELPIALGFLPRPLRPVASWLERFAYRKADLVIALSPFMADGVKQVHPSTDVTMVPNCADTQAFDVALTRSEARGRFDVAEDAVLFYYAGNLGVSYDPEWLAAFTVRAHFERARVLIAGEGAGVAPLSERLAEAGIAPESVLLGALPRRDVAVLARAADCAISSLVGVPALEGNSLNKVFDALAAGRPVVTNHGGWLNEFITTHGIGWRLPRQLGREDVHPLVQRLSDAAERQRLSNAALEGAAEFDRERWFTTFEEALLGS